MTTSVNLGGLPLVTTVAGTTELITYNPTTRALQKASVTTLNNFLKAFTGSRGFTGSKADTGFTGSVGRTGSVGVTGFRGSQGEKGFTGSASTIAGFTGSRGAGGFTGSSGNIGAITGNVIPTTNSQFDIGLSTQAFREIWVTSVRTQTVKDFAGNTLSGGGGAGSGANLGTRQAVQITTSVLTPGQTATGSVACPKGFILYKMQANNKAWVRLYDSSQSRVDDNTRTWGDEPLPYAGIIVDFTINNVNNFITCTPCLIGYNADGQELIHYAVTNQDSVNRQIQVTLTLVRIEA